MNIGLKWSNDLSTGIKIIDTQHKVLFDLANDLKNAYDNNAGAQVIDTMFSVIQHYSFKHFATEEDLLSGRGDFHIHCYEHYQLLRQLNQYAVDFRNNRRLPMPPSEFLEKWLTDHIKGSDIPALEEAAKKVGQLDIDDIETFDEEEVDQRQHKRIRYDSVVDKKITGRCYNANSLKGCTITVVDMAVGGLKIYADRKFEVDDLLIINCKIGRMFNLDEKVRVTNVNENLHGVQFINPKTETITFFTELYGADRKSVV